MATLQVKNLPDDVHGALRRRAVAEGTTLSDLVTRVLVRETSRPSMREWLADLEREPVRASVDSVGAVDAGRDA